MDFIRTELLREPLLEFGEEFLSSDPKTGITRGGFFSTTNFSHRSEIHYAIIGTNNNIDSAKKWISNFEKYIQATSSCDESQLAPQQTDIVDGEIIELDREDNPLEDSDEDLTESQLNTLFSNEEDTSGIGDDALTFEINKKMNPDFPGVAIESVFKCGFYNDESNNISIRETAINAILDEDYEKFDKAIKIADLYISAYNRLIKDSITKPNICIVVIPKEVFKKLSSIKYSNGRYFNLRRYLKSQLITIPNAIPVQILLEETVEGTKKALQDATMQGWNFTVASYYKNGGTPWTLSLKDKTTCFIGISFHRVHDSSENLVRSSIAQAFNYEGKGIIFIGKQFEWDSKSMSTKAPHLTHEYANNLIQEILQEYKRYNKVLPARVVIHKTTEFWDASINPEYAEAEGFRQGINTVLGEDVEIDLVTIRSSKVKVLRSRGKYPVLRGTLMKLNDKFGVLYTTGYIPYFESYPGMHIPRPLEVSIYSGDSTIKKVCDEIMALTKLNFNNCSFYDSLPITIRFAQRVGEIIQYMSEGATAPNKYFYYM